MKKTQVYAVYIIHQSGTPLYSRLFQAPESAPPTEILSALLSAFWALVREVTDSDAKTFTTSKVTYHMELFRGLRIVLVTNDDRTPELALYRLGLVFMRQFGYELINDWDGDVAKLNQFDRAVEPILNAYFDFDEALLINPTKKFTSVFLFRFPNRLKSTAISLVTLREGSLEQIAEYCDEDPEVVDANLSELQNQGYVGAKVKGIERIFFYLEK